MDLSIGTTATALELKSLSGSIFGEIGYINDSVSVSSYKTGSGSLNIKLKGWTGLLTAESGSGSKNVGGHGLERWNDSWKKGSGASTAAFTSQSGSIKVEVL